MKIITQGIAKKKINVILSLLVLLLYQFSHPPPSHPAKYKALKI